MYHQNHHQNDTNHNNFINASTSPNNSYLTYSNTLPVISNNVSMQQQQANTHLNQSSSWNSSSTTKPQQTQPHTPSLPAPAPPPTSHAFNENKFNDSFNAMSLILSPSKNNSSCNYNSDNNSENNFSLNNSISSYNNSNSNNVNNKNSNQIIKNFQIKNINVNNSKNTNHKANGTSHVPSSNSSISLALYQYDYNIKSAKFAGTNNSNLFNNVNNNSNNNNRELLDNNLTHTAPPQLTNSSHKPNGQNNGSINISANLAKPERTKSIVSITLLRINNIFMIKIFYSFFNLV